MMMRWMLLVTVIGLVNSSPLKGSGSDRPDIVVSPNQALPWTEMELNRGPPPSADHLYSREEMACLEERKVYVRGKCWELLSRADCEQGYWLVLDAQSQALKATCRPKLCDSDQAFYPPTATCLKLNHNTVCTKKQTSLQVDWLGYGACKCAAGAARAMAGNGVCYKLYSRGPCDPGYVVQVDTEATDYPALCLPDPCNSTSPHTILLPYKGKCYEEGSEQACDQEKSLMVDVHSGKPTCSDSLNTFHLVNPPPRCHHLDHTGDCRDRLTVKHETDNYLLDLRLDKTKHKNKYGLSKG